jgi:Asp-tRNA(Asn)/Glu-tRNA(Gln) amidotransferase A subunit family amidase
MGHDPGDPDTRPRARAPLVRVAAEDPPVTPHIAFVKSPIWDQTEDDTRDGFAELVEALGDDADEVELPDVFGQAHELHQRIMAAEVAKNLAAYYERGRDRLSDGVVATIEQGLAVTAVDHATALEWREVLNAGLDEVFERYDAILTPATAGAAPAGIDNTGDPAFCTLWTLCGTPAVTLPLLQDGAGLPIGAQLVGARRDDARLLRNARWLVERVGGDDR